MKYIDKVFSRCVREGECLIWTGALNTDGYPTKGNNVKLHRFVCSHYHEIEGLVVRHTCDNIRCLNPEHLIPGTVADNVRDMDERGRRYRTIPIETWQRMGQLIEQGFRNKEIAEALGVDARRVSELRNGKRNIHGNVTR